jgi:DNA-directed RNA polymerase specialized sigma24 family protein
MAEPARIVYNLPDTPQPDALAEWRDWLRQEMAGWPYIPEALHRFLDALHWRQRAAVCLILGERMTYDQATIRLGVSERTLKGDVTDACALLCAWRK